MLWITRSSCLVCCFQSEHDPLLACLIDTRVMNRVVQKGLAFDLEVFDTGGSKGWAVRCKTAIPSGAFVCCYEGEIVSVAEARKRLAALTSADSNYLLVLQEHSGRRNATVNTCIDAGPFGSVARFINHSHDPNLRVQPVRCGTAIPRAAMYATKPIPAGMELTFDYGGGGVGVVCGGERTEKPMGSPEALSPNSKPCHCGASQCDGLLPSNPVLNS
eukprot:m.139786 g.139786  ORF g.139786 m.139786 type:complete len:217 (+) comp17068_c1_seq2:46-696(+)